MLGSMFIILLLILVAKSINHSVDAFSSTRQLDEYDNQNEFKITLMPEIKAVIINIGSNIDPPMPPEDDDSIAVIAVEPVLETASKISKHHRLYVIVCAIADVTRFQMMNLYNIGGLSSSLQQIPSKPFYKDYVNIDARKDRKSEEFLMERRKRQKKREIVSVMPLSMLINAIPSNIEILHIHTDMQGSDFMAVKSAGSAITRVRSLQTEVFLSNRSDYDMTTITNHIDDWTAYMGSMGYSLDKLHPMGGEGDAYWILNPRPAQS